MTEKCMGYHFGEKRIRKSGFIPGVPPRRLLVLFCFVAKIKILRNQERRRHEDYKAGWNRDSRS